MLPASPFTRFRLPAARRDRWALTVALAALVPGAWAAWSYHAAGLTLSHYDAKAHLVVARRVLDSLTPGWQQIGAVWLPLPHLLNLLPAQVDLFYRTGAAAIAISMLAFAVAVFASARIIGQVTGSAAAAAAGGAILALNQNVLYLQATPMTEPLLLGLTLAGLSRLIDWVNRPAPHLARQTGCLLAAAWLTRYEAWPVVIAAIGLAGVARWRLGATPLEAARDGARLALFPLAALAAFLLYSRLSVGEWFVAGGFYLADNPLDTGRPVRAAVTVWWGTHEVSSYPLLVAAAAGAAATACVALARRERSSALVTLALAAAAALPWYAFHEGHPFRIRYMVPLIAAVAVSAGVGVGWLPGRARLGGALALAGLVLAGGRPIDFQAPMVVEAQLDSVNERERRELTRLLVQEYHGEPILASMASLAHYMQELSADGFAIRDFIHEGNGALWLGAIESPRPRAGWMLMEEVSEGGDLLARRARAHPEFLDGYVRVGSGGGVALYRRVPPRPR